MNALKDQAQQGLELMKSAIVLLLESHPEGIANSVVADELGLRSDYEGQNKDYLSWSILGLLVNEGKVGYRKLKNRKVYFILGEK